MRSVAAILLAVSVTDANEKGSTSKFLGAGATRKMHLRDGDLEHSTLVKAPHRSLFSASRSAVPGSRSPLPLSHSSRISSWLLPGRSSRIHRAPGPLHAEFDPQEKVVRDGAEPGPLKGWPFVYKTLLSAGVGALTREEVVEMQKKGAVIVDVRNQDQFEEETMEGAVSVPFFVPKTGSSFNDNLQKVTAFILGVKPTQRNPEFATLAKEKLPQDKPLIIACNRGGKLLANRTNSFGTAKVYSDTDQYTLSLKAAYELYTLGFKNLYFLTGGFRNWRAQKFPTIIPEI